MTKGNEGNVGVLMGEAEGFVVLSLDLFDEGHRGLERIPTPKDQILSVWVYKDAEPPR